MANKVELVAEIAELSEQLGTDVPATDEMTKADLEVVVENLKAGVKAADTEANSADAKAKRKAARDAKKAEEEEDRPPYYLLPGKSVTTMRRGIQADGDEVKAEDFRGGQENLEALIEAGYIGEG